MNILVKNQNNKNKIKRKTIEKFINNLPAVILNLLEKYNAEIIITNLKNEFNCNFKCEGAYIIEFENNNPKANIYIDEKNNIYKICNVLGHEIGHFLDEIIGIEKHNVNITKENIKKYSLTETNENIRNFIKSESDFFTQIKQNKTKTKEDIFLEEYDIKEEFANCIAEILLSTKITKMFGTKCLICKELNI